MQIKLEDEREGATIIPVIISTDKTQLTLFRNKTAYPIYLTIGNIPKDIRRKPSRRAQILLGYLPTTRLSQITSVTSRRRTLANLFHTCMSFVLAPLKTAGVDGLAMMSGDGVVRRCHPIFAIFAGDYPEQILVSCLKNGECPTCPIPHDELGSGTILGPRALLPIIDALDAMDDDPSEFTRACLDAGIKPIYHPFWYDLPYVNIYQSITPDVLHQLYQGLVKHLVAWLISAFGANEIDARCRRMPPNHGTRLFTKGISTLSRVSGQEHRDMCRVLLGLIVDLRLPNGASTVRLVRAVRSMLDFFYLAQYKVHTKRTLSDMDEALSNFHTNKSVFIDLGIRTQFNLPKLHNVGHYKQLIMRFGTTDNYSTQTTERLHIDFAKEAYEATNHKEEFAQMTIWLERLEKMTSHAAYIKWRLTGTSQLSNTTQASTPSLSSSSLSIQMTRNPSARGVELDDIALNYGAEDIRNALAIFIAKWKNTSLHGARLDVAAASINLPMRSLSVFHKIRFSASDQYDVHGEYSFTDVAHAKPASTSVSLQGRTTRAVSARFDTVLVDRGDGGIIGVKGNHNTPNVQILYL